MDQRADKQKYLGERTGDGKSVGQLFIYCLMNSRNFNDSLSFVTVEGAIKEMQYFYTPLPPHFFPYWGSRDGAVVRALASHQCGPGLIRFPVSTSYVG